MIALDGQLIGPGQPTFVIAEIGVNHDGSIERAFELVNHARDAGADAVKLQLFSADRLVAPGAKMASYQLSVGAVDQVDLLRRYEMTCDDVERVVDRARTAGLVPIATPFSPEDVFIIEQLEIPLLKIASPDCVNKVLLDRAAKSKRPMIVSTGAATMDEISTCCSWLDGWKIDFALMHCVSSYPTPTSQAQLGWIRALSDRFGRVSGYSDHTTELFAGALAVACGASIIEKHLTWNRFAPGPDHAASADPPQFRVYVDAIRQAEKMLGVGAKRPLEIEADVRKLSRQSLVAARRIRPHTRIEITDLTTRRPASGVCASRVDEIVGARSKRTIEAGEEIDPTTLERHVVDAA